MLLVMNCQGIMDPSRSPLLLRILWGLEHPRWLCIPQATAADYSQLNHLAHICCHQLWQRGADAADRERFPLPAQLNIPTPNTCFYDGNVDDREICVSRFSGPVLNMQFIQTRIYVSHVRRYQTKCDTRHSVNKHKFQRGDITTIVEY